MYAIDFRNFHNAIHGLLLFTDKEQANETLIKMSYLENKFQKGEIDREDYSILISSLIGESEEMLEEIDFRKINSEMHDVIKEGDTIYVINDIAVDIY